MTKKMKKMNITRRILMVIISMMIFAKKERIWMMKLQER